MTSKTIVMTSGVFDILNAGHLNVLFEAKKLSDILICGIQDDDSVFKSKGSLPILTISERIAQINALNIVDEIVVYSDTDQRKIWDKLKPNIIVQGDDYLYSAERSKSIEYLKKRGIRLILLPRTEGISSTMIKKRVIHSDRKDSNTFDHLKLIKISDLSTYEDFDQHRVDEILKNFKVNSVLRNPVVVGSYKGLNILIDGNNRVSALRILGIEYVIATVHNYRDVILKPNTKFKNGNRETRLSEFVTQENVIQKFKARTHEDIYELIISGKIITNGETWHQPLFNIINLNVPLCDLNKSFDIKNFVNNLIKKNSIRYYTANVYICDDY